jgi:hypothetical protein
MLELAMQTAEAASEENNHRLVLQAVREVTRLVTLINKITCSPDQNPESAEKPVADPRPDAELELQSGKVEQSGKRAGKKGLKGRFFKDSKQVKHCEKNITNYAQVAPNGNTTKYHDGATGANR